MFEIWQDQSTQAPSGFPGLTGAATRKSTPIIWQFEYTKMNNAYFRSSPSGRSPLPASEYDRFDGLAETSWYRDSALLDQIVQLLDLSCGIRILDVGCGAGDLLAELSKRRVRVVGIDASRVMLQRARSRGASAQTVQLVHGRFEQCSAQLGLFDRVVCKNVLHLVDDIPKFLARAESNLVPGGRLLLIETVSPTPSANAFVRALFAAAGVGASKRHYFSSDDVRALAVAAGFGVERQLFHSQKLFLHEWLRAKDARATAHAAAEAVVSSASADVQRAMEIRTETGPSGPDWALKRLQYVALLKSTR
jgi:ubiquinone/menaquinone biosynthesis C-methylase UbiE